MNGKKSNNNKLYTLHGERMNQGVPAIINGRRALAYLKNEKVVGYTTLDEMNEKFYKEPLPTYIVDF